MSCIHVLYYRVVCWDCWNIVQCVIMLVEEGEHESERDDKCIKSVVRNEQVAFNSVCA